MNDKTEEKVEDQAQAEEDVVETTDDLEQLTHEELVEQLREAQASLDEARDQALRAKAELENTRRRAERDVAAAHKYALEKLINELLPVKDSLEMGEAAARVEGAELAKVGEGVTLTVKMLSDALAKFGVQEINPMGEKFNPELHQAMSMQDVDDAPPNTVINVFQKGYLLNDRLVRPAMVVVASVNSTGKPDENTIDEMA